MSNNNPSGRPNQGWEEYAATHGIPVTGLADLQAQLDQDLQDEQGSAGNLAQMDDLFDFDAASLGLEPDPATTLGPLFGYEIDWNLAPESVPVDPSLLATAPKSTDHGVDKVPVDPSLLATVPQNTGQEVPYGDSTHQQGSKENHEQSEQEVSPSNQPQTIAENTTGQQAVPEGEQGAEEQNNEEGKEDSLFEELFGEDPNSEQPVGEEQNNGDQKEDSLFGEDSDDKQPVGDEQNNSNSKEGGDAQLGNNTGAPQEVETNQFDWLFDPNTAVNYDQQVDQVQPAQTAQQFESTYPTGEIQQVVAEEQLVPAQQGTGNQQPDVLQQAAEAQQNVVPTTAVVEGEGYDVEPARGQHPEDFTSYIAEQRHWSAQNLPAILFMERGAYTPPTYNLEPRRDPSTGEIPLDNKGKPLARLFRHVPERVSTNVEGWRLEAWVRLDPRLRYQDVVAAIPDCPAKQAAGDAKKHAHALQVRTDRARKNLGLNSWREKRRRNENLGAVGEPLRQRPRTETPTAGNTQEQVPTWAPGVPEIPAQQPMYQAPMATGGMIPAATTSAAPGPIHMSIGTFPPPLSTPLTQPNPTLPAPSSTSTIYTPAPPNPFLAHEPTPTPNPQGQRTTNSPPRKQPTKASPRKNRTTGASRTTPKPRGKTSPIPRKNIGAGGAVAPVQKSSGKKRALESPTGEVVDLTKSADPVAVPEPESAIPGRPNKRARSTEPDTSLDERAAKRARSTEPDTSLDERAAKRAFNAQIQALAEQILAPYQQPNPRNEAREREAATFAGEIVGRFLSAPATGDPAREHAVQAETEALAAEINACLEAVHRPVGSSGRDAFQAASDKLAARLFTYDGLVRQHGGTGEVPGDDAARETAGRCATWIVDRIMRDVR
ncbi:MAG: Glucose-responsive transcription factor [Watsoniomyces obsoletus]|nr:MAG: Glucose-responsive transcription factor [Watsoniomyces obsoletus]